MKRNKQTARKSAMAPEQGAVLLETVPVILLFLVLSFVGMDFLRLGYATLTLQFAATRAAREAIFPQPGQISGPVRAAAIEGSLIQQAEMLGVIIEPEDVRICPTRNLNCASDDAGLVKDFFVVDVSVRQRGFVFGSTSSIDNRLFRLSARVIGRNEP